MRWCPILLTHDNEASSTAERNRYLSLSPAIASRDQRSAISLGRRPTNCEYRVLSAAGYSTDGHAYVYAAFGRTGYRRGAFGAGWIFLLKRSGGAWVFVASSGVWAT